MFEPSELKYSATSSLSFKFLALRSSGVDFSDSEKLLKLTVVKTRYK